MTEQKIKEYIKKEILFKNIQTDRKIAEIGLEMLLTSGLIDIHILINLKDMINKKVKEILLKED